MKTVLVLILFCTVSLSGEQYPDGIAALVNGDVISFSQLRAQTAPDERPLREVHKGNDLVDAIKKLRASHLNRMIDRLLLLQELKRQGHPLPAQATDAQIDATIKDRFSSDRQQWLKRIKPKAAIEVY